MIWLSVIFHKGLKYFVKILKGFNTSCKSRKRATDVSWDTLPNKTWTRRWLCFESRKSYKSWVGLSQLEVFLKLFNRTIMGWPCSPPEFRLRHKMCIQQWVKRAFTQVLINLRSLCYFPLYFRWIQLVSGDCFVMGVLLHKHIVSVSKMSYVCPKMICQNLRSAWLACFLHFQLVLNFEVFINQLFTDCSTTTVINYSYNDPK